MEFIFKNKLERQLIVYAEFKCSLIIAEEQGILQKREPNSAALNYVNTYNNKT